MTHEWQPGPEDFPPTELAVTPEAYPNLFERTMRVIMHGVAVVALVLASLLMLTFIRLGFNLGDAVDRINAPQPYSTGCPVGDGECGG